VQLHHARGVLDLSRPVVMGVLNRTPDSFSDGGHHLDIDQALTHALRMHDEGAALVDIGGESTRPGAAPVPEAEELARVLPLVERLAREPGLLLSVDTSSPLVMRACLDAGAAMINDVRALRREGALQAAAAGRAAVCLMHMQGEPDSMQAAPSYDDVRAEVLAFLAARIEACSDAGIGRERIVIDPGFGFGKRVEHNLRLLAELAGLESLRCAVLAGLSRKSLLQPLTGRGVGERLAGSVALAALAVYNGALIVRAHDVAATLDAVRVAAAVRAAATEGDAGG
jgi:dihydropteroate synthase